MWQRYVGPKKIKPIPYNLITNNARRPLVDTRCSMVLRIRNRIQVLKLQKNMRGKFKKLIFSSLFLLFAYNDVFKVIKNQRWFHFICKMRHSEPQKFFWKVKTMDPDPDPYRYVINTGSKTLMYLIPTYRHLYLLMYLKNYFSPFMGLLVKKLLALCLF